MLSPQSLLDSLLCPKCNLSLSRPTTLHCGHSICSAHKSTCPVLSCSISSPSIPRIPPQSTVLYHLPPLSPTTTPPSPTSQDVVLNKIISLVQRTIQLLPSPPHDPSSTRPRKRPRLHLEEPDLLTHLRNQASIQRNLPPDDPVLSDPHNRSSLLVQFDKDLFNELTCDICSNLFFQPVTTPCQHTFCTKCLHRSLDHSPCCPVCRKQLPNFSYFQDHPQNATILKLLLQAYPLVYKAREDAIEQEERDARLDTPIFVCQLSFPGMPTLMHFFEPRYRLMLRRCLESTHPQFGMIMAPKSGLPNPLGDYGTMLDIRSVQVLPDGRSMVETWGSYRFRILERGVLDGYMVGRIERIDDYPDDLVESIDQLVVPVHESNTPSITSTSAASIGPSSLTSSTRPTNDNLMDSCRQFLDSLQRGTAPWVVQRLSRTYGSPPTDAASFSFWVAQILPIDEGEKAKLLPIRSARLRLLLVVHWIEQLNNNWYAFRWFMIGWMWFGVELSGAGAGGAENGGRGRLVVIDARGFVCLIWTGFVLTAARFFRWI